MRCYRWEGGELTKGIVLSKGRSLPLGHNARTGAPAWIGLHKQNPPAVIRGEIHNAYPYWVNPMSGSRFLVFAQPHDKHENDARILVHVSTQGHGRGPSPGWWHVHEGVGESLAAGVHDGPDPWASGLVCLHPRDVLRITPSRSDDAHAIVYSEDGPHAESWIRHVARELLREELLLRP